MTHRFHGSQRELQQALERLQEAQNKLRDEQTYNDSAAHRRHIAGESMQQMIADWSTKLSAAQLEQEELQKVLLFFHPCDVSRNQVTVP